MIAMLATSVDAYVTVPLCNRLSVDVSTLSFGCLSIFSTYMDKTCEGPHPMKIKTIEIIVHI